MDGSLAGQRIAGRVVAPISTHFAVTVLPTWVLAMASYSITNVQQPAVRTDVSIDPLGHRLVYLSQGIGPGPGTQLWLLYSDYMLCLNIVRTLPIPLFPQESQASILNRIRGALRVEFAGRGKFDGQK